MSDKKGLTYTIHNCHVHLFNLDYIPKYFLHSMVPVTIIQNKTVLNILYRLLRNTLNRYSAFIYSGLKNSHFDILEELRSYYPERTKFTPLCVDFDYMKAGSCKRGFLQQLEDMAEVKNEFPEVVYPFIGIDPRRPNLLELVKHYIEESKFSGLKVYPSLGFFPNDKRLYPIYEYAEKYGLPLTTHCIPVNKNHYRGKITDALIKAVEEITGGEIEVSKKAYDFGRYFNHPYWWKKVLEDFPNLKINFAHFGGDDEWNKYLDEPSSKHPDKRSWYSLIRDLMKEERFPNVYADISFTVYDRSLYPVLKNLVNDTRTQKYVLFGSDFYMLQKDYRERRFGLDVRGYLDDMDYWRIAEVNPRRFLSNKLRNDFSPIEDEEDILK